MIHRLVIGAPFGNYLRFPQTTPTLGTYTAERRAGPLKRLWRVLATVRYYHGIRAWKNRLRLPNPGIVALVDANDAAWKAGRPRPCDGAILSVSGRTDYAWSVLLGVAANRLGPAAVELNVSCPNCPGEPDRTDYPALFKYLGGWGPDKPLPIVKLPPVDYLERAREAVFAGVTSFHCCNTLPTPGGGLSGKPLMPLSLRAVRDVRRLLEVNGLTPRVLIGGGGVTGMPDAKCYLGEGATHVAVASTLFFPWQWPVVKEMALDLAADRG